MNRSRSWRGCRLVVCCMAGFACGPQVRDGSAPVTGIYRQSEAGIDGCFDALSATPHDASVFVSDSAIELSVPNLRIKTPLAEDGTFEHHAVTEHDCHPGEVQIDLVGAAVEDGVIEATFERVHESFPADCEQTPMPLAVQCTTYAEITWQLERACDKPCASVRLLPDASGYECRCG